MRSLILGLVVAGCANDPVYVDCAQLAEPSVTCIPLEAGQDDGTGMAVAEAKASLSLPVNTETADDAAERATRATALGVDVPYVKLGDIEVGVEWTITNLSEDPGDARIELNGATEYFVYDPDLIVLSDDDEAPPTPPLDGDVPIHIDAGATVTGIFREDQVREASIDIDQVTRANVNPFAATLTVNKNAQTIQPMLPIDPDMPDVGPMIDPNAIPIPREAFAQMIRVDLVFKPSAHMILNFQVRVRDVRGIMNDKLLAAPLDELQAFAPQPFEVAPTPPPAPPGA
ncbi:MAG: hypothetical protein ABI867_19195 [Kofleriaceae bacterium]